MMDLSWSMYTQSCRHGNLIAEPKRLHHMAEERTQRRLAAILAADVVGYSRMMEQDEAGTLALLKSRLRDVLEPLVTEHQGRVFKSTGDGVLVEFGSAVNAVQYAVDLQERMATANSEQPDESPIVLRIGVNLGDVMVEDGDLFGEGVNIAARLESIAEPGGVLVSGTAYDHVRNKVKVGFEDLGLRTVKNIAVPVRVYRVQLGAAPTMAHSPQARVWRRRGGRAAAVGLFLIAISGLWWFSPALHKMREVPIAAADARPSVAVLPFSNLSGDQQQDYFSDGLSEDILIALARFPQIVVFARQSSFSYKGKTAGIAEIGRSLGAHYVLEGSVQKSGDRVRVTAQLIEAATGGHLWAERYDRPLTDIFTVQDEIAERIVVTLVASVERVSLEATKRKAPEDVGSYDLFLQARELLKSALREDDVQAGVLLERAIALDPNFAPSYAELAEVQVALINLAIEPELRDKRLAAGFTSARKALSLDPSLPDVYRVLSKLYRLKHDYAEAEANARKAIELNPGNAENYAALANILADSGQPSEAVAAMRREFALDPFHRPLHDMYMGKALVTNGEYEKAVPYLRTCMERAPEFRTCPTYLAIAEAQLGHLEKARDALALRQRIRPLASVRDYRASTEMQDGPQLDRLLDGLRKAGLPE
jgi:TolB-like protein/class 3 adenylate cyclase/tetratricopeptide (TPR) repeat protein